MDPTIQANIFKYTILYIELTFYLVKDYETLIIDSLTADLELTPLKVQYLKGTRFHNGEDGYIENTCCVFCIMFFLFMGVNTSLVWSMKRLWTPKGVPNVCETSLVTQAMQIILSMVAHATRSPGRGWSKEPHQCTHW